MIPRLLHIFHTVWVYVTLNPSHSQIILNHNTPQDFLL